MRIASFFSGIGGFELGLQRANNSINQTQVREGATGLQQQGHGIFSRGYKPDFEGDRLGQADSHYSARANTDDNGESRWEGYTNISKYDPNTSMPEDKGHFRCVFANDIDRHACQCYREHFGSGILAEGDIRSIPADSIPDHDLLVGGFPCQPFSVAGKRRGTSDARGTLFGEILRVLEAKRPAKVLLENVPGLLSIEGGETFAQIILSLGDLGYFVEWQVLDSQHFGVPQHRERVFIVGHLGGEPARKVFPVFSDGREDDHPHREEQAERQRLRDGDTDEAIGDIADAAGQGQDNRGAGADGLMQINDPNHSYYHYYDPLGISPTVRSSNGNKVPKISAIPVLTPDRPVKRQNGRRFKRNGDPSFTLTGQDIHGVMVPQVANTVTDGWLMDTSHHSKPMCEYRIRRLTPTECERLQGFPDGWTSMLSDTQRYKCLGNAVTVNVIEFLGRRIRRSAE